MTLTRRQRRNIWWRYTGIPLAHGIATIGIYLVIAVLVVIIASKLIR